MSSTTERSRGQALAIFTLSLSAVIMLAALVFDGGMMMLERRDQQSAADAAAIAAARYIKTDTAKALAAAVSVASANGFTDGVNNQSVSINSPPIAGPFKGRADFIEVEISSTRPSLFAGIMGVASWQVGVRAVGTDLDTAGGSFSIFALDPHSCDALLLSGNGTIIANGNVQVNSDCNNGAMRRQGGSNISLAIDKGACNVVGDIKDGGGQGYINCLQIEGAPYLEDPLLLLPPPSIPGTPKTPLELTGSKPIPSGCPGGVSAGTLDTPAVCQFTSSYAATVWRLYPGLYPGGLKLQGGTFYLEPGIYYLAGGGLDVTGTGTFTYTVDPGGTSGPAGGVMFYNTAAPTAPAGPVILNGSSADIQMWPYSNIKSVYDGILIFQDRTIDLVGDDVIINGNDSTMQLRGTIYAPAGDTKVNGGAGVLVMDQVISWTYTTNGAPGTQLMALREEAHIVHLRAAGLVE